MILRPRPILSSGAVPIHGSAPVHNPTRKSRSASARRTVSAHTVSARRSASVRQVQRNPNFRQEVCVRIPLDLDNGHKDIYVPTDIKLGEFVGMLCAEMKIHPVVTEFGWKTVDDNQILPPRALRTQAQLENAIQEVLRLQMRGQQSRVNPLVMVHLNYHGLAYRPQMLLLEQRLRCANHPHRWCYIKPGTETREDHQGLGVHELHMWGKRMYDGLADPTGTVPPDCFNWSNPYSTWMIYGGIVGQELTYNSGYETKALLLETVLDALDTKYPRSNFFQYQDCLHERGIIYAVNALHFPHQYFMSLGMSEGAVGTFLEELNRAMRRDSESEDENMTVERELSVVAIPDSDISMDL